MGGCLSKPSLEKKALFLLLFFVWLEQKKQMVRIIYIYIYYIYIYLYNIIYL